MVYQKTKTLLKLISCKKFGKSFDRQGEKLDLKKIYLPLLLRDGLHFKEFLHLKEGMNLGFILGNDDKLCNTIFRDF